MNTPKVSIIVPVYNVEKYLSCCVDSLLNQKLADIEIILVDDGSPDTCPAMCDEYAKQDYRIRVIHKRNEGQGYARNSGIEIATGEYIAFVDSDDYVESNTYQKSHSIAMETKADGVYFNYQLCNDQGNTWGMSNIREVTRYQTGEEIRGLMLDMIANRPEEKLDRYIDCSACCVLYRNDMIKKYEVRFKSERELHSEDLLFNLDYLLHSSSVIAIPDVFYNYRMNLSSFSHTIKSDKIDKNYFYYQYLLEMLKTNNFEIDGYLRATRHLIADTRTDINHYIQSSLSKREKMQWLKEVAGQNYWKEIASSYPYKQLPLKHTLWFYLLYNGFCRLLYHYSKFFNITKEVMTYCKMSRINQQHP